MPSNKTVFACQKCGAQTLKWAGRCSECQAWGTMIEEIKDNGSDSDRDRDRVGTRPGKIFTLNEIKSTNSVHLPTGIGEVDRVLGGGLSPGAVILLAGEPGIGKSTLVAQIAQQYSLSEGQLPLRQAQGVTDRSRRLTENTDSLSTSSEYNPVLYVSGEESPEQLKQRFERLHTLPQPLPSREGRISILPDTNAETIAATIESIKPQLVIVDSVQTLTADAADEKGLITQLRASVSLLAETAKRTNTPLILIGQVTKSLDIAGPKSLEHIVDVVLTFEGDRYGNYRMLRAAKNRFGSTDEIGVFAMTQNGLEEVKNPSLAFLETRSTAPGAVATVILEGIRPIILEIQALAHPSRLPYPERRAAGFDLNRLNLLLAVLEKATKTSRFPLHPSSFDVHVNVTSGFKIKEPAADLAVLVSLASSLLDKALPQDLIVFGEVGLGGELRPVRDPGKRIQEAKTLNFKQVVMPQTAHFSKNSIIHPFTHLSEVLEFLFGKVK